MKSKLSPQGRKIALTAGSDRVRASVEAVGARARGAVEEALPGLGARALSSAAASGTMGVEIGADRLEELAKVPGVGYVDVGGRMGPARDDPGPEAGKDAPFTAESVMPIRKPDRAGRDRAGAGEPEARRDDRSPSPGRSPGCPPEDGRSPRGDS